MRESVSGTGSRNTGIQGILHAAFSDIGINPSQYRIVQLNTCYSGGEIDHNYLNTDIPQAFFGNGSLTAQAYVGWCHDFYPDPPIGGTQWSENFWMDLGIGWNVQEAAQLATESYGGTQAEYLYIYGDCLQTTLYR